MLILEGTAESGSCIGDWERAYLNGSPMVKLAECA